ncbi:hypothetical protein DER29_2354 [Micromonospora sp. M71_S20]|nr:hypothetical protein DER29_2354 [Micromonospora sp. M71_S20]
MLSFGQARVLSYRIRHLLDIGKGYGGTRRPFW